MPFWTKALVCVILVMAAGASGGLITAGSISGWYAGLEKPPGTPPNWIFGPVWSVLYAMMGFALARVWHFVPAGPSKRQALIAFAIQFALNLAWTPVFFGAHLLLVALLIIAVLWITILMTILAFRKLDRTAAWFLIPYLIWVSYASYLNAGIFWLNR